MDADSERHVLYTLVQQGISGVADAEPPHTYDSRNLHGSVVVWANVKLSTCVEIRPAFFFARDDDDAAQLRADIRRGVVEGLEPLRQVVSSVEHALKAVASVAKVKRGLGQLK